MDLRISHARTLLGICLTTLTLYGCSDAAPPAAEPTASVCPDTPPVTWRPGYPLYEVAAEMFENEMLDDLALCNIAAHYHAGYAIVSTQEVELEEDLPVAPEPGPNAALNGSVLANVSAGSGEPWVCHVTGDNRDEVRAGIDACLARLRAETTAGNLDRLGVDPGAGVVDRALDRGATAARLG